MKWSLLLACALLAACGKKGMPLPEVPVAKEAPPRLEMTVMQMLVAVKRGHPNADVICYDDGLGKPAFLIQYPEPTGEEIIDDDRPRMAGWYFLGEVPFYNSANNTFYVQAMSDDKYVPVAPDATGLTCVRKG